jgi:hypothetical protein
MKNVVLVSLPRFDLVYLSGALAILAAIAKENDYGVAIYDYNVDLNKSLSRAEWDELDLWLLQVADSISPELENKIKSKFVSDIAKFLVFVATTLRRKFCNGARNISHRLKQL